MDAKAKVVAWLSPDSDGKGNGLGMLMHDTEQTKALRGYFEPKGTVFIPLTPLTDHETALAELREGKRAWISAAVDSIWGEAIAEHKLRHLLSQLDALVSELELDPERHPDDFTDPHDAGLHEAAQRIRTLTNSANGGE